MKYNKVSRLLVATLVPALLAISLPATPAFAAEAITLGASQGTIGQQINISGSGFTTGNTSRGVNILFGENPGDVGATIDYGANIYQKVQVAELNANGTFSSSFVVPARLDGGTTKKNVTKGNYYVFVTYFFPSFSPPDGTTIVQVKPFTVEAGLVNISPNNGPAGTEVTITGSFFGNSEGISIAYDGLAMSLNGAAFPSTSATGTFGPVTVTVPPGAGGQHLITVSGATSGTTTQVAFTVKPKISIAPTSGAAGQLITASGSGFGSQTDVSISFAGVVLTPARTGVDGSFSIIFPALQKGAGNYEVAFSDAASNSAKASFALTGITLDVSPDSATVGSSATVSGSNFLPSRPVTVTLNNANVASATSSDQGTFSVSFTVPALPSGTYNITATDGTNNGTADFGVTTSLEVSPRTTISAPGNVGSELTVKGVGFDAGATVIISYDGATVATTTAAGDKTFTATFLVPPSKAGEHTITASYGTVSERTTFFLESTPPPTPSPLKPEMGVKASARTSFDWQDVTDPSGVTYTLQIATGQDFSAVSIVLEKTGIEGSQYIVPAGQELKSRSKDAPYYWRISAVDDAGNQSLWSGTGTFYISGGLPQMVVYLLIGIGVLALVLLAFWVGKRVSSF